MKRYEPVDRGEFITMVESEKGGWVKWEDYVEVLAMLNNVVHEPSCLECERCGPVCPE